MARRERRYVDPITVYGRDDMTLKISPYARCPVDERTILSVQHRHTGDEVAIVLERDAFDKLADALDADRGRYEIEDPGTIATFTWVDTLRVCVQWLSSGYRQIVEIEDDQRQTLVAMLRNMSRNGWEGWRQQV